MGLEGAADLAVRGGADHAVVAVGVGSGDRREFVSGQLGGLLVVEGGLLGCGGGWERSELEQGGGGGGAVEPAVGAGRAVVGAFGAAVVGVQIDRSVSIAECPGGERERLRLAVGVAGVGEQIADRDAGGDHALEDGDDLRGRVVLAGLARWMRRTSSGTSGPCSSWTLVIGLEVVAVEQLVSGRGGCWCGAPSRPRGPSLAGRWLLLVRGGRCPGFQIGPVDRVAAGGRARRAPGRWLPAAGPARRASSCDGAPSGDVAC